MSLCKQIWRKVAMSVATVALAVVVFLPMSVSANTVIWSLAEDEMTQWAEVGDSGMRVIYTDYLMQAGNPTMTIIEAPQGHNGIRISNRGADYHTIDIERGNHALVLNPAANTYRMTVTGRVVNPPAGTVFIIGGPSNPWNWLGHTDVSGNGNFTAVAEISNASFAATDGGAAQFNRGFRLQTNNTATFYIYNIVVERLGATPAPTPEPTPAPTPEPTPEPTPAPTPEPTPTPPPATTTPATTGGELRIHLGQTAASVRGVSYTLDVAPFISEEGRTMLPLRFVTEAFGGTPDFADNTAIVTLDGTTFRLPLDVYIPDVGTPVMIDNRVFVPIRFFIDEFNVDWRRVGDAFYITLP